MGPPAHRVCPVACSRTGPFCRPCRLSLLICGCCRIHMAQASTAQTVTPPGRPASDSESGCQGTELGRACYGSPDCQCCRQGPSHWRGIGAFRLRLGTCYRGLRRRGSCWSLASLSFDSDANFDVPSRPLGCRPGPRLTTFLRLPTRSPGPVAAARCQAQLRAAAARAWLRRFLRPDRDPCRRRP